MDTVDKKTRSRIMSAIRSKGNKTTELKILALFRDNKLKGWRRHYNIYGNPDFCWEKYKVALFVDGCFWHGCPRCYKLPSSNSLFWERKMSKNVKRDKHVTYVLRKKGWSVIRVWECRISEPRTITRIEKILESKACSKT